MPSQSEFVRQYYPYAKRWEAQTGIPAAVFLAIGASETNWGAAGSLFGIKGASPSGKSRTYDTWEQTANGPVYIKDSFAVYDSPDEGFQHFIGLISQKRYAPAWQNFQKTGDWRALIAGINAAGYATDPIWHQKIASIAGQVDQIAAQTGVKDGGFTMPQSTAAVDPVMQQEFQRAQANYSRLSQRASYLQQQLERPDLDQAARTRYQGELGDIIEGGQLKAARDEMLAFWSIVNPGKAEAPSARMNAEANWIKTQYDIARGFYSDQLNYGQLALEIIKANNAAAGAAFEQWYRTQQISQGDLGLLMEARAKQQAEQLALLGLRLQQAEFISKQQAWNAVNLFQQAEAGQKLYQPGFGPNDAMAQAGRMLGLNAPVIEANPVDPAQFEPEAILARAGNVTPQPHDDEWWGYTGLRQWAEDRRTRSFEPAFTGFDPSGIELPSYDNLAGEPGAGEPPPATVGATTGKALRGSLESLVNAVATAPVMPATTHTRAGVDAVTAAIQQWMPYSPANNLTESERAAGLQAAGNPFVAEGRPDGSYRMDEQGRMMLLPERTPPANQSQPNPLLPRKNWVFDPSKKRWVYRPAGG